MLLKLHIVLTAPPANLSYALQKGSGGKFDVVQVQHSAGDDLYFDLAVEIKGDEHSGPLPDFKGPFVQGPVAGRFIYLNIGTYAGHADPWGGRLKIPLTGITWNAITNAGAEPGLQTTVPGKNKNGAPNCATVKPFAGWVVVV